VKKKDGVKDLVVNRRARFEYELLDRFEAGIALVGSEVKSIRAGEANLAEAFIRLGRDGAWLMQCHVSPYVEANRLNHDPVRKRRLLLQQNEILKLQRGLIQKSMTIVPLRLYLKGHLVKLELALGRGRKLHDKRNALKKRQADMDMKRR
jgi:SsrA-binding protein